MTADQTYSIAFLGDMSFGENYQAEYAAAGGDNVLERRGYDYCLANFRAFLRGGDLVVANLETPLTPPGESPLHGRKQYVHWSDVEMAPRTLVAHNVAAVSLANNHTMDYGPEGLTNTIESLTRHGIAYFGAGRDAAEAGRPYVHDFDLGGKQQRVAVFGAFEVRRKYVMEYGFYAGHDRPGVRQLKLPGYPEHIERFRQENPDAFVVVFPHWGLNYIWHASKETRSAHALLEAGADLILGHGAHMLGAIEKHLGRWVVYGLGNFVFNSAGDYGRPERDYGLPGAHPYSLVAKLILSHRTGAPERRLRLYPILSDNQATGYQPRFVDQAEADAVLDLIAGHSPGWQSLQSEVARGRDATGPYFELSLN